MNQHSRRSEEELAQPQPPPGDWWTQYQDSAVAGGTWWYYDGPCGKWYTCHDNELQVYMAAEELDFCDSFDSEDLRLREFLGEGKKFDSHSSLDSGTESF